MTWILIYLGSALLSNIIFFIGSRAKKDFLQGDLKGVARIAGLLPVFNTIICLVFLYGVTRAMIKE